MKIINSNISSMFVFMYFDISQSFADIFQLGTEYNKHWYHVEDSSVENYG